MSEQKNYDSYKQIRDLIATMDTELKNLTHAYVNSVFANNGVLLTNEVFDIVLPYTREYIETSMEVSEMKEVLSHYEILNGGEPSPLDGLDDDSTRALMLDVKDHSLILLKMEKEINDIKKDASDIMNEYIHHLSSQAILKNKEETLKIFKEANELEADEKTKAMVDKKIEVLEKQMNYSFLTERINKLGYKEMEATMARFFDDNKGKMIVNKFKASAKKFGYNPDIFAHFLNIEESFLPEEYHPFNNFFLSICMSYVGYANYDIKSERLYVSSIMIALGSLIYHNFSDPEDEKKFIEVIKSVIDIFKNNEEHGLEIIDKFKMLNRSYSKHPDRIKAEELSLQIKRNTIFTRLEELKIDNPFTDDCDVDEALKYLEEETKKLKESQLADAEYVIEDSDYVEEEESDEDLEEYDDEDESEYDPDPFNTTPIETLADTVREKINKIESEESIVEAKATEVEEEEVPTTEELGERFVNALNERMEEREIEDLVNMDDEKNDIVKEEEL